MQRRGAQRRRRVAFSRPAGTQCNADGTSPQVAAIHGLELIVVLLVLGILAAIAVPTFNAVKTNSAERTFQSNVEAIVRNANAIGASGNTDGLTTEADVTAALYGADGADGGSDDESTYTIGAFAAGAADVTGTVGSYTCTATITVADGAASITTAASCS